MLIRFEVENFRSLLEPAELSMVAIDEDRPQVRRPERIDAALVPVAGIFGPNASGKSNVLAALNWLRSSVATSLRRWDDEIPVEPHAFGPAAERDSSFALELAIQGVRFEYLLDVGRNRVAFEALYHYPEGRRRRIFERDDLSLTLQRGLGVLRGSRELLTERSLALSIMRRFDEPLTSAFARVLLDGVQLGGPIRRTQFLRSIHSRSTMRLFETPSEDEDPLFDFGDSKRREAATRSRSRALALLRLADLGVSDVKIQDEPIQLSDGETRMQRIARLVHTSGTERVPFEWRNESAGTSAWFELIGPVLGALERGSMVLFDELDASLHPKLTAQIIRLFEESTSNPHGAQLIFTAHDTNLLNHLNRDEVWLTQKDERGASTFAPLSDFAGERVRRSQNLESGYLSGRFGALPDLTRPALLRELGLIG